MFLCKNIIYFNLNQFDNPQTHGVRYDGVKPNLKPEELSKLQDGITMAMEVSLKVEKLCFGWRWADYINMFKRGMLLLPFDDSLKR